MPFLTFAVTAHIMTCRCKSSCNDKKIEEHIQKYSDIVKFLMCSYYVFSTFVNNRFCLPSIAVFYTILTIHGSDMKMKEKRSSDFVVVVKCA